MTISVYLFLLLSLDPAPVVMVLDQFTTVGACQDRIKELKLSKEDEARLSCKPIITSPIREA